MTPLVKNIVVGIGALLLPTAAHAISIDLTTTSGAGTINNAGFKWTSFDSTGTGVIDSFLRIQENTAESGWNTSGTTFNDEKTGNFTHDMLLSAIPVVSDPMTGLVGNYYEVLLDIAEPGSNSLLSLYGLKLFTSSTLISQTVTGDSDLVSNATLRYDLGTGNSVEMDSNLASGNGHGDVFMYFPTSLFSNAGANDYFYLFAEFGRANSSEGSYEEFSVRTGVTGTPTQHGVPDGGTTAIMLGLSLLGLGGARRMLAPAKA